MLGSILLGGVPIVLGRTEEPGCGIVTKPTSKFIVGVKRWVGGQRLFEPGNHMELQTAGVVTARSIHSFSELENIIS